MRRFLIFTNLVTVCGEGPGAYRIALQGQHTCGLFGLVANRNLTEILSAEEEERWRHCFDLVRNGERPVRLATRVGTKGLLWLDCETFIAPLSDKGTVSFFWVFVSWIAEQPYGV
jgi:hypothetical protein